MKAIDFVNLDRIFLLEALAAASIQPKEDIIVKIENGKVVIEKETRRKKYLREQNTWDND